MAYQDNHKKIAEEFAMMDGFMGRVWRMERRPQENPIQTHQPNIIDAKQAAKRYGGVMQITSRRPGVQQGGQPKQGGVWIMDYSKNKSKLMAF